MEQRKGCSLWKQVSQIMGAWKGKLLYEYFLILAVVVGIVLVSFLLSRYIVEYSAVDQSRQATDVIFGQAQDQIKIFEEDVDNLYNNVVQNGSVAAYFQASDFYSRWIHLKEFHQVVANNMRIYQSLRNVLLYNSDGELIGNKGDTFVERNDRMLTNDQMTFSGKLKNYPSEETYFEVGFPVYTKNINIGYDFDGYIYLLFDVNNLQKIVDGALPNEESAVAILDGNGAIMVKAGKWDSQYSLFEKTQENEDDLVYLCSIGNNGWKMVSVVPKESMMSDVTQMQQINMITYIMVLFAMILVCTLIYRRVIQPVSRQTAFMTNFTQDTGKRIEVTGNNEICELARKMNEMLDDIDALNKEIINSHKKYLELDYAKKQTEMIAYKSQMNPHFLYNTFNCIRGMALYNEEREIAEMTMALSNFFRYSIQGEEQVTISEALENLQQYALIIQYRFNGRYRVEVEAPEELLSCKIPKMLIQPLVENAVLHGLETKAGNGVVRVDVSRCGDGLEIQVQDDGSGIKKERLEELHQAMEGYDRDKTISDREQGIGVLNVYRRVRLFYGREAKVEIYSEMGIGTRILMKLPIEER